MGAGLVAERDMTISYQQVAVFDSAMERPFNNWTGVHVAQGFSYRRGSVSFRTVSPSGRIRVRVSASDLIDKGATRVFVMPLEVEGNVGVEVATITESLRLGLPNGRYRLQVQIGKEGEGGDWLEVYIAESELWPLLPRILVRDEAIVKTADFLMEADPA